MNASDIIADRLVTRGIYLERYKAGRNREIMDELEKLETELTKELAAAFAASIPNRSARIRKLEAVLIEARRIIREVYKRNAETSGRELARIALNEHTYMLGAIQEATVIELAVGGLNYDHMARMVDNTIIEGAKSADWWKRQGEDLTRRFSDQMRMGVMRSENMMELVNRVRGTQARAYTDGIMMIGRRQAEALVRSSVQVIANQARLDTYNANSEVVGAIQWLSTLDSRTTHICMALSGKLWTNDGAYKPIDHKFVYPGPTAHWGCRSTQVPVLKKWDELVAGQDQAALDEEFKKQLKEQGFTDAEIAKIKRNTRASVDGQVARDLSFSDWLKEKPHEFQDELLGKGRAKLFRDGKITLSDLVDQRLRPLTLDQLQELSRPRRRRRP